jgi:TusA-related sulfurtransferase
MIWSVVVVAGVATPGALAEGQHTHQQMLEAGGVAMGFDQTKASHHFRLLASGGVIEVHVNDPADDETRRRIAAHLEHISHRFASGDFAASLATHGEEPSGVTALKAHADRVRYAFEPTAVGGRVRISTDDGETRSAIHAFLRYQIREHRTGDSTEVDRE